MLAGGVQVLVSRYLLYFSQYSIPHTYQWWDKAMVEEKDVVGARQVEVLVPEPTVGLAAARSELELMMVR